MWREVVYFQRHTGVTPEFALHTATLKNAQLLGVANETGSIETGKSADFIVLDVNPLDDLCALRNVELGLYGRQARELQGEHLPKIDAELDGIMNGLDNDPFVSEWNIASEKSRSTPSNRHEGNKAGTSPFGNAFDNHRNTHPSRRLDP